MPYAGLQSAAPACEYADIVDRDELGDDADAGENDDHGVDALRIAPGPATVLLAAIAADPEGVARAARHAGDPAFLAGGGRAA